MHYVSCIFANFILYGLYAKYVMSLSRAGVTNRLYRLKPRVSRSKGASNKLWYTESIAGV